MKSSTFTNPFKPGAGHMPPYLAGRQEETREFEKLLKQGIILQNMVLTGLRGVGKTVLLDTFKPLAIQAKWLWAGTDLSESASTSEETLTQRLITDLSIVTSNIVIRTIENISIGFTPQRELIDQHLNYETLLNIYRTVPGLIADKLKGLLEFVWASIKSQGVQGIIFAYDEAQTMADHAEKDQYPLALLLDVFQSIQKKNIPFMLVLTGLPTLFPKLVESRTFSERMFRIVFLKRLNERESREAIHKPIEDSHCPVRFDEQSIDVIIRESGGYPYFIQFICKEVYDVFLQKLHVGDKPSVPINEIIRKLDKDFFSGRWARVTDRQRQLLSGIAALESCDDEFTVQEVVEKTKELLQHSFSSSHVNQMLSSLINMGLIYKNRHGKYSFAVPLLGKFILRQQKERE